MLVLSLVLQRRDVLVARLWRVLLAHSLTVLLLATCLLVLLLVLDSHKLQSAEDVRGRVLRDMVGFDTLAFHHWLSSNISRHEPEFVLR